MELVSYLILGLLIVISPGADFVLVLKNSLANGRRAGVLTGIGIGLGVCIHISYSILGISHLISQNLFLFSLVKYAGAAYLIYLGLTSLFRSRFTLQDKASSQPSVSAARCFFQGFLCNMLNPKTMLFFLSVFSQLISVDNSNLSFVLSYGIYISLLHMLWFSMLALLVSSNKVSSIFHKWGNKINQVCGIGLVGFGGSLAVTS